MALKPGLYVVATPIGNILDITIRALQTLAESDLILCEDTRVTNKLLAKHNIKAPLKTYNDHSDDNLRSFIKQQIINGKAISLVSDAGTPLISDPGYKLVKELKQEQVHIETLPGPSALISALSISALPTDKFLFCGFLPKTQQAKQNALQSVMNAPYTIIFYETAPRLLNSLQTALEILGDREANVGRELTKLYQESISAPISKLIQHYTEKPPKGEIVLSFSGYISDISRDDIITEATTLLKQGLSAKSTTDQLFAKYGDIFKRSELYKIINTTK